MVEKKICFIASYLYPALHNLPGHGGAEIQFSKWIKVLQDESKYKLTAIVGDFGQNRVLRENSLSLIRNKYLTQRSPLRFLAPFSLVWQLLKLRPHYIVSGGTGSLTIILVLTSKLLKTKYIHRMASLADVDGTRHKALGWLKKPFINSLKEAKISVQNEEQKKILFEKYALKSQIIKNVIDIQEHEIQLKEKKNILWVSRFLPMKKPNIFVELCSIYPDESFVMICPKSNEYEKEWLKLKEDAARQMNLKFIEFVPLNEIQSYFNEAKIFVNTSDFEGFPNTFLQAGNAGTPILSLSVDPDGFINKHACGISCSSDIEAFKRSVEKILSELQQFSENIRYYTRSNFGMSRLKDSLSEFFDH